jgi:beta-glucosidase-like glycosyl hydrolase
MKKIFICLLASTMMLMFTTIYSSENGKRMPTGPAFLRASRPWADSVFAALTPDQRIAQLFMVAAYSDGDKNNQAFINNLIETYNIGGLIYFKGNPTKTMACINQNQARAKTPMMIGIDGEWGVSMRIDSTTVFPHQLTLGAVQDAQVIYNMGVEVARQCKLMGVHINFAPVVDINNNPNNPVINDRSFGDDKYNVARLSLAYMSGMQQAKILACAKHFPGHGDTDVDSHTGLPIVQHTRERLDTLEFLPFQTLIRGGVASIMIAHMALPNIEPTPNLPATLSKRFVSEILKGEMDFKGLVFTDAMNMKGLSAQFKPGDADVKALLAGNDVLLFSEDVPLAIKMIKQEIEKGTLTQDEIDAKAYKILCAKNWVGLNAYAPANTAYTTDAINTVSSKLIRKKCYEEAITIAKANPAILPIKDLDNNKISCVAIGAATENEFQKTLTKYANVANYTISKQASATQVMQLMAKLKDTKTLIITLHEMTRKASVNWGLTDEMLDLIDQLATKFPSMILVVNGNPYALKYFDKIENTIITYEDNELTQSLAAQLIFGAINARGRLPISVSSEYKTSILITDCNTQCPKK